MLWGAASSDLISTHFLLTIEGVIHTLQVLFFLGPVLAFFITKRVCLGLQKKDREIALHGFESGRIVRLPGGEYIEVHEQLDDYERWRLVSYNEYTPLMIRPDADGRILAPHVHAMMDVSDGLLIDAARMALASGLSVSIGAVALVEEIGETKTETTTFGFGRALEG